MSDFDEVLLFCEDEARRPTVRLLEVAVQALRREVRMAATVEPRPAGGKSDVKIRVRHARQDKRRAFGVRDRDFLERKLLDDQRRRALSKDAKAAEAWPLGRYCVESYLIDPAFLARVVPGRTEAEWHDLLEDLARARRWADLVRAALTDARWQMSRLDWPHVSASVSTRDEAFAEISIQCAEMARVAGGALNEPRVRERFKLLELDFAADGPLALRVDGKELLKALGARLKGEGQEPKGGLLDALLSHAERHECPRPLLDEVRQLLLGIQASLGSTTGSS
jgi:hypothetical protein